MSDAEAAFLLSTGPPPLSPIEQLLVESGVCLGHYPAVREWLELEVARRREELGLEPR